MLTLLLFITAIYCYNWSHTLIDNVSPNSLDVTFDASNNPIILYNYNINSTSYLKYHRCLDRTCSNYMDNIISKYNSDSAIHNIPHSQISIKIDNNKVHIVHKFSEDGTEYIRCSDLSCTSIENKLLLNLNIDYPVIDINSKYLYITGMDKYNRNVHSYRCKVSTCNSFDTIIDNIPGEYFTTLQSNKNLIIISAIDSNLLYSICDNLDCSSVSNFKIPIQIQKSLQLDAILGKDNLPFIFTSSEYIKCNNKDCTDILQKSFEQPDRKYFSIGTSLSGYPTTFYFNEITNGLLIYECLDLNCSKYKIIKNDIEGSYVKVILSNNDLPNLFVHDSNIQSLSIYFHYCILDTDNCKNILNE